MKRLLLMMLMLIFCTMANAQSTTSKVTIGDSYVVTSLVDIYPYQSGRHTLIDYSVHFKMKAGIKFKINDVKDTMGTTLGYVIIPWNFHADSQKSAHYQSIVDSAKAHAIKQKILRDSIASHEAIAKSAKLNIQKDSLNVEVNKNKVLATQQKVAVSEQLLFNSIVNIDVKKVSVPVNKKDKTANKKIANFKSVQTKAKSQISEGEELSDNLKKQLFTAVATLPLKNNVAVTVHKNNYNSTANQLEDDKQQLTNSMARLQNTRTKYSATMTELSVLKKRLYATIWQSNENVPDSDAYRVTKEEKNDKLDTPSYPSGEAATYSKLRYLDSWANDWQFFIPAKDFADKCSPIFPKSDKFTWGFLTLPVKMRFDNDKGGTFDFEQNLNFGLTFGDKHQLVNTNDISLNYLAGLSVVNVPLDNATATTTATSTTAISVSLGFMFQYNSFQIGAFIGRDFAGAQAKYFNYQGKPWLGFAIGISLFGEGKTTATSQTQ